MIASIFSADLASSSTCRLDDLVPEVATQLPDGWSSASSPTTECPVDGSPSPPIASRSYSAPRYAGRSSRAGRPSATRSAACFSIRETRIFAPPPNCCSTLHHARRMWMSGSPRRWPAAKSCYPIASPIRRSCTREWVAGWGLKRWKQHYPEGLLSPWSIPLDAWIGPYRSVPYPDSQDQRAVG